MRTKRPPHISIMSKVGQNRIQHFFIISSLLFFSLILHFVIAESIYDNKIKLKEKELEAAYEKQLELEKQYDSIVLELFEARVGKIESITVAFEKLQ